MEFEGFNIPIINQSETELQRTNEWFNQRKGRFTGSAMSDLMSCTQSTAKMEWGRPEKIIDFGETAMKYVYSRAKERQRDKVIKSQSSVAMNYGKDQEEHVKKMLIEKFPNSDFQNCGFEEFLEGIAGASPDGKVDDLMALEIKCATSWDNVFARHEVPFDQKHQDFWQINCEMLALKVDKTMYVVAEPSENIFEPNITDLSIIYVNASPIHQNSIIQRCLIGDAIIKMFLNGTPFREAVRYCCTNHKFE
jgi:hypothetical protein